MVGNWSVAMVWGVIRMDFSFLCSDSEPAYLWEVWTVSNLGRAVQVRSAVILIDNPDVIANVWCLLLQPVRYCSIFANMLEGLWGVDFIMLLVERIASRFQWG